MKKIPMRMCCVTRERLPKKELIRIVATTDGVIVDETGKVNGHGIYLKRDVEVVNLARKKKILSTLLNTNVEDKVYDEIINVINK